MKKTEHIGLRVEKKLKREIEKDAYETRRSVTGFFLYLYDKYKKKKG